MLVGNQQHLEYVQEGQIPQNQLEQDGRCYLRTEVRLVLIGHPIIGDPKYGDAIENEYFKNRYGLCYQVLCAYKIKFELCESLFEYMENRVFTVAAPKIYSEICLGEGLIGS